MIPFLRYLHASNLFRVCISNYALVSLCHPNLNNVMKKISIITISAIAVSLMVTSCGKNTSGFPQVDTLPATYDFENVNYSGQTTRIGMLEEMVVYMKTANTTGVTVDATTLKNMFSNTGSPFANPDYNTSGKQLKNKFFSLDVATVEAYMDSIAMASTSAVAGSNGTAGVVVSTTSPSKKYLLGANGMHYQEIIEKSIMGAVFYYQAVETYLSESGIGSSVDNTTVIPGEGTAMQHHWDEAFGYLGVPVDFPANTIGTKYWGKYSSTVTAHINSNTILMDEFKRGRKAINSNNHSTKNSSAILIKATWEKLSAAMAIHYINEGLDNFSDDAIRCHVLSEGIGFIKALKYNSGRIITLSEMDTVLGYIGNNLYTVSSANLQLAKDMISSIYSLDDVKDVL